MDKQPVTCPWCGHEMTLRDNEYQDDNFCAWYECVACLADSPLTEGYKTIEEARLEAYKRAIAKPLQKPMTWEEVETWPHDWIFLEFDISGSVYVMEPSVNKFQTQTLNVRIFGELGYETYGPYGDGFRCWDHYPTEEERRAAPWKT